MRIKDEAIAAGIHGMLVKPMEGFRVADPEPFDPLVPSRGHLDGAAIDVDEVREPHDVPEHPLLNGIVVPLWTG